ncbi:hypothetical protein [uncultured Streptomyces sp.]|uniref:hypothetical protein n=1 Tax=uncultured Streptomyces sp. TaxID=174707 RepID=UPI0026261DD5|nr:hypothetical protein [uncultured Streptomyces sp.]
MSVFAFRFRGPAGGLAVNLDAEVSENGGPPHALRIHRKIWLGLPASGLYWEDAAWLAFGVRLHAQALSDLLPEGLVVRVVALDFPLSDYRCEASALAMDGWLCRRFALPPSGAGVTYDRERDRFAFTWGGARPSVPPTSAQ